MLRRFPRFLQSIRGAASRPEGQMSSDPLQSQYTAKKIQDDMGKNSASTNNTIDIKQARQWMEVRQAARILNIKEPDLYGLTPDEVHSRWHKLVKTDISLSTTAVSEATVAAEVLIEYCDSAMHAAKTKQHYTRLLQTERKKLGDDIKALGQVQQLGLMRGIGAFVMLASFMMIVSATALLKFYPEKGKPILIKLGSHVKAMSNLYDEYREPAERPRVAEDVPVVHGIHGREQGLYKELVDDVATDLQRERDLIEAVTNEKPFTK